MFNFRYFCSKSAFFKAYRLGLAAEARQGEALIRNWAWNVYIHKSKSETRRQWLVRDIQ